VAQAEAILIVDDNAEQGQATAATLKETGLAQVNATTLDGALAAMRQQRPSVVLLEVGTASDRGLALLRAIRTSSDLSELPVVVAAEVHDDQAVARALAAGADDYVRKPTSLPALVARLQSQLRVRRYVERVERSERDLRTVVQLTQALASSLDIRDILFTVVRRVAEIVDVDRCSIVLVHESGTLGYVVATSDDESLRDLPIQLEKYPEIREVLNTRLPLVIEDVRNTELLAAIRQEPALEFRSLALAPLLHEGQPLGVIFLRARRQAAFLGDRMALVHTLANATAIAIRNARILQSLRSASEQDAQARLAAERRMKVFQRYADFFESAADGMVVADHAGHILFANPKAGKIIGATEEDVRTSRIQDLLGAREMTHVEQLMESFRAGVYPQGVDINVRTQDGGEKIISVNFSSVLRAERAVLCTFRDVTAERRTEQELKHTKEFLERVIESSVDAIVSADMAGRVLLYNRAAARIFGHSPGDVIGKMNVEQLYPPGVARQVMHLIRDPEHGGPDRLEEFRVDMLNSSGETVPVKLSAALIFDNDQPVGSVGIFTDIRESLRMEAELARAQQDLREREKDKALAELAGTAAHELNQPLTAVIGNAELLKRYVDDGSPQSRAAGVIVTESERMAEIVKKIGKITRYETMSYVGSTQILDLDKASGVPPPESEPPPSLELPPSSARLIANLKQRLIQTEKLASLGQVVTGVVHELAAPLTAITSYAGYLREKMQRNQGDPGDVERLIRISDSAQRILEFTRDLVAYARPTLQVPAAVDLHQVIRKALIFCDHELTNRQIQVELALHSPLPYVLGAHGALTQIFVNLCINAAQAMKTAGGTLTIASEHDAQASELIIRVADRGVGIPSRVLPQIFDPFFTTKSESEGTGLGLSIVNEIVQAHRGTITVQSTVGKGTTFKLTFPSASSDRAD
jgi:PAS domain S-box-containing protein